MMKNGNASAQNKQRHKQRRGIIAVIVALLLVVIIGCIALAVDVGLIALTRTQLQAAADAASLGGGTELLSGLGKQAYRKPSEVKTAADTVAVAVATANINAERSSTYVEKDRDIKYGRAVRDPITGAWVKTQDATPYNYVEVTTLRAVEKSSNGDQPLPLLFARIFSRTETNVAAISTAVILPAKGFYIKPGSSDTADVMPFAYSDGGWDRYDAAQDYYDSHPDVLKLSDEQLQLIVGADGLPIFGVIATQGNTTVFNREFTDNFIRKESVDGAGLPIVSTGSGSDKILEVDIYPRAYSPGNFGTVDFGSSDNSTAEISRQIEFGLNDDDLSYYSGNAITLAADEPLLANGDTGISAGMQSALTTILNECRAIAIFTGTATGSGNTSNFSLVRFEAVTVVEADLTSKKKTLKIQPCTLVDNNAVADMDTEIGESTTIFTPLILIQ